MDYRLLGPLDVSEGGRSVRLGGPKPRALLAVLLVHRGTVVSVDALIDALWGEAPPMAAENLVQTYISRLRKALGRDRIRRQPPGYLLDTTGDEVDADRVTLLLADADAARAAGETRRAAGLLREALSEWRGDALADVRYEAWAATEVDRLERLRTSVTERAVELDIDLGRTDQAIAELHMLVAADPLHEPWWEMLVRALRRSGQAAEAASVARRAEAIIRDELGAEPGPRLRTLAAAPVEAQPPAPDGRRPAPGSVLPLVPTSFRGREQDVEEVRRLVARRIPVTLVGPGGVGKTRLALEVARQLLDEFRGGVWVVELAGLAPTSPVVQAVVSALEVEVHDDEPLEDALIDRLVRRQALVLLDNCEHVLEAVAPLAHAIVARAPGVHLMATSRQPLGVPGEVAWPVRPLPVGSANDASPGAAEQLFVDRARAVLPEFGSSMGPAESSRLTTLCRRLDGVPLAIELAAPWVASLTLAEIDDRLTDRFGLLATESPMRIDRHRTLRATVDWSYRLLADDERRCLRFASVFAGGFDLAAAEAMCGPACRPGVPVVDLVATLVAKSMIVHEVGPFGSRYRLLETLREYAAERLAENPEEERGARQRHAAHYLRLAQEAETRSRGPEQVRWLTTIRLDEENLQAAFTWLRASGQDEPVIRLATLAWWYWEHRGNPQHGLERLLSVVEADPPLKAELLAPALLAAGSLAQTVGSHALALRLGRRGLAAYRSVGDEVGVARCLQLLGRVATNRGDFVRAEVLLTRAILQQRSGADTWHLALALHHLGLLNRLRGRYDEARADHEESLALFERVGDDLRIGYGLLMLGAVSLYEGDYVDAADRSREALGRFERVAHRYGICHANQTLADVRRLSGDATGARPMYEACLAEFRELGDRNCIASVLAVLALLARTDDDRRARQLLLESLEMRVGLRDIPGLTTVLEDAGGLARDAGRPELAVVLATVAARVRATTGAVEPGWHRRRIGDELRAARSTLGDTAYRSLEVQGRTMPLKEAVRLARAELGGRRSRGSPERQPPAAAASASVPAGGGRL